MPARATCCCTTPTAASAAAACPALRCWAASQARGDEAASTKGRWWRQGRASTGRLGARTCAGRGSTPAAWQTAGRRRRCRPQVRRAGVMRAGVRSIWPCLLCCCVPARATACGNPPPIASHHRTFRQHLITLHPRFAVIATHTVLPPPKPPSLPHPPPTQPPTNQPTTHAAPPHPQHRRPRRPAALCAGVARRRPGDARV